MHCDQIRPLLPEYAAGRLPGIKLSWVVQHLAGCEACRQAGTAALCATVVPDQHAAAAEVAEPQALNLRRPVPRWVRPAAGLAALALIVGSTWSLLRSVPHTGLPGAPRPLAGGQAVPFQAAPQRIGAITLSLSVAELTAAELRLRLRFEGENLEPATNDSPWVTVTDARHARLPAYVEYIGTDGLGLFVDLVVGGKVSADELFVSVTGVLQTAPAPWRLTLPKPPSLVSGMAQPLPGDPDGTTLTSYGLAGDLMQINLHTPYPARIREAPTLTLQDGAGASFAPTFVRVTPHPDGQDIALEFPKPSVFTYPLQLAGSGQSTRYVGPWQIKATLISGMDPRPNR